MRDTEFLKQQIESAQIEREILHRWSKPMSTNFDLAFDRLIGNEGGYVNNPADPGGETNWGISKRSYPNLDIATLTRDDAKQIYLTDFWNKGGFEQLPFALGFQAFDIAVNSGITEAVKLLQQAAGVVVDGVMGPQTLAAIEAQSLPSMLMQLAAARLDFWRGLSTWGSFGSGWSGRAAANLRLAAKDLYH